MLAVKSMSRRTSQYCFQGCAQYLLIILDLVWAQLEVVNKKLLKLRSGHVFLRVSRAYQVQSDASRRWAFPKEVFTAEMTAGAIVLEMARQE